MNLVADGDIPTTAIVRQVLALHAGSDNIHARYGTDFDDGLLASRPTLFSRTSAGALAWVPRFIAERAGRYALFVDDNFWECDVTPELEAYYGHPLVRRTLDEFLRRAAVVVVNSVFLGERLKDRCPEAHIEVIPAHFDFSVLDPPVDVSPRAADAPLRVGYAGTSRGSAFDALVEAIEQVLRERPGEVEFEFIGFLPERLEGVAGVTAFPGMADYRSFLSFKRSRAWDVGLAPLGATVFTRAKTNNKFREYGALSIAGIYQDVEPYRGSVEHGVDGLLVADSPAAWHDAILQLMDNRQETRRIGAAAYRQVKARHDLEEVAAHWAAVLDAAELAPIRLGTFDRIHWRASSLWAAWALRFHEYALVMRRSGLRGVVARLAQWLVRQLPSRRA
jgi:glycosyltransferase involved in cell wall biosynthesis